MKRLVTALTAAIILAGCTSQTTIRYNLSFNVTDQADIQSLSLASMRVVQRRLDHLSEPLISSSIDTKSSQIALSVTIPDKDAATQLTKELTEPFTVEVMAQTGSGETADIKVEGQGSFRKTGITEKDLQWVDSRADPASPQKGEVGLAFSDAGRQKMQTLFRQVIGSNIGLFVRGMLVSKLHVETTTVPTTLVIRDIPSVDIANVFSDDMNVGLHVVFTPAP